MSVEPMKPRKGSVYCEARITKTAAAEWGPVHVVEDGRFVVRGTDGRKAVIVWPDVVLFHVIELAGRDEAFRLGLEAGLAALGGAR